MGRRLLNVIIVLIGLLAVGLIGIWLARNPLARLAADYFLPRIEQSTGIEVRYEKIHLSILGRVRLTGLRVSAGGRRIFKAARLEFDLSPWALLARRVRLDKVTAIGPQVDLAALPLSGPGGSAGHGKPWTIEINGLQIARGRAWGWPQVKGLGIDKVTGLAARGRVVLVAGGPSFEVRLDIDSLSARLLPRDLVVKSLKARLKISDRGLVLSGLDLKTAGSTVRLSGKVEDWTALAFEVKKFQIDPREAARFAPWIPGWLRRVPLTGRASLTGRPGDLRLKVQARRGRTTLTAAGRFDLTRPQGPAYDLSVTAGRVPLRSWARNLWPDRKALIKLLPGRTSVRLIVKGRGFSPKNMTADGRLKLGRDWLEARGTWQQGSFQARLRLARTPVAALITFFVPDKWARLLSAPASARVKVQVQGRWSGRGLPSMTAGIEIGRDWLSATGRFESGRVRLTRARGDWGWLAWSGRADSIDRRRVDLKISGQLRRLPAGPGGGPPLGLARLKDLRVKGPVTFQARCQGPWTGPDLKLSVFIPAASRDRVAVTDMRIDLAGRAPAMSPWATAWDGLEPVAWTGRLSSREVKVGPMQLRGLTARGFLWGLAWPDLTAGLSLAVRAVEAKAPGWRLTGVRLAARAEGTPSPQDLSLTLRAGADRFQVGRESGRGLSLTGNWDRGAGRVTLAARHRRWGPLAATAGFRLQPGPRLAVSLTRLKGLGLRTVGVSHLEIGPAQMSLDRLNLVGRGGRIAITGVTWSPRGLRGDVRAQVPLGRWASLTGLRTRIAGRLSLEARWRGTPASPLVRAKARLRGLVWRRVMVRAADLDLNYRGRRAQVNLAVKSPGISFQAQGRVPLNLALTGAGRLGLTDGPIRLTGEGKILSLGRLSVRVAGLKRLFGGGRVEFSVRGTARRPRIEAQVKLTRAGFRYQSAQGGFRGLDRFQLQVSGRIGLQYRPGRLAIQAGLIGGRAAVIKGDFSQAVQLSLAPFQWRALGRPKWKLEAALPNLASLNLYLPGLIGLKGSIRAGLISDGRGISGRIRIENVAFRSIPQGMDISGLGGLIRFTGQRMVIDKFTGRSGQGRISLSGGMDLAGGLPKKFNLKLAARRAVVRSQNVRVVFDADGRLTGTWTRPEANGRVVIRGAKLFTGPQFETGGGDVIVVENVRARRDLSRSLKAGAGSHLFKRLSVNIRLDVPEPTPITGLGLNVDVAGRVGIHKKAGQDLRLKGVVNVLRGYFALQGSRFYINQGRIVFAGLARPNPSLNLTFEQRGRSYNYIFRVRGTAASPRFELATDPPLPAGHLVRFFSLGQNSGGRDGSADLTSMAGAMIGNTVLQDFTRLVRLPLAPDAVRIVTDEFSGSPGVEVGRHFGRKVYVTVGSGVGTQAGARVRAEYRLNRNWTVEGQLGSGASTGVDLFYEVEF
jgi:hypothetical protein